MDVLAYDVKRTVVLRMWKKSVCSEEDENEVFLIGDRYFKN